MAARGGFLKLLDAYVSIGGDTSGLDKAIDDSTAKATKAGAQIESALSPRRVLGALGAAAGAVVGAAFGLALTGANQLDAATQRLVADAGLTGKAAEDAGHSLASLYENNLQGFDAIGAAMAKVHNDLGLTGAAADAATEKFLKFSTATGQDAAGAVTSFDDILDAWNLTAADAGSIMDKLVVSHQKYGGAIAESESALSAMAPAMQAANMSIDDGIAMLNLFNAAGIDAAKAPAALAKAVKELKPGQDLNDLIAQIGAIEDPTLRGQEAMRIFGARSGIGLAQAIKPGMTSLADLTASLGDTAGATDTAADASLSWGDKAALAIRKITGPLAEFGTQFNGLLMVSATIGPGLTKGLLAGLGGLGGLLIPKIAGQLTGAIGLQDWMTPGTMIGKTMGKAAGVAMSAGIVLAVAGIATLIEPELHKLAISTHDAIFGKKGPLDDAGAWLDSLPWPIGPVGAPDWAKGSADAAAGGSAVVKGFADAATAGGGDISGAGQAAGAAFATGVEESKPLVQVAAADVIATFATSMLGVEKASKQTGADGMLAMAAGVTAARAKPLDAFGTLVEMLKHQLSPMAEVARLKGELTSKQLAAGLKSGDPAVKAQASAVAKAAADRLGELAAQGGASGRAAMAQLNAGIRSKVPEVRAAAQAAKDAAVAQMNAAAGPAGAAGAAAGAAFAAGLTARASAAWANLRSNPYYSTGLAGHAAGAWRIPADELAFIHADEMVVPAVTASRIRSGEAILSASGAAQGGGGRTINVGGITVNNPKPEPASTSTKRELQKLAAFGSI